MIDSTNKSTHDHIKQDTCVERQYSPLSLDIKTLSILSLVMIIDGVALLLTFNSGVDY